MFISKRKFNLAIEEAKRETEQKMWEIQRVSQLEEEVHHRIDDLAKRVASIEDSKKKWWKFPRECPFAIKRW